MSLSRALGIFSSVLLLIASTAWAAPSALHFRITGDPNTLDWNLAHTSYETHILMNIMEGLVEEGPELDPRPALADKWEISPDGKVYTFHIRAGVKWTDGRVLKASDFRDSWLRLLDSKTDSTYASFLFDIENAEAFHDGKAPANDVGIKVIGDSKLQVRLKKIVPYFLHLPTFWVTFPIRLDLIKKYGKDWAVPGKIATLGPYRLEEWKKGKLIRLKRSPDYFGKGAPEAPSVDQVDIVIETDDKKARAQFEGGKLDFLLDATTEDLLKAKQKVESHAVKITQFPYLATYYLGFNVRHEQLRNGEIRRAIAIAIDRENIAAALQGGQVGARSWVPPGMSGHNPGGVPLTGTLYEARGALAKAGFVEGKGFPKLQLWVDSFDGAGTLSDFMVRSIHEKLGIEIEAHVAPSTEFLKAVTSGQAALFVNHWGADFPDPANFFDVFASGSGANRTGWTNAEYDQLLTVAHGTLDMPTRLAAYAAAEKILLDREVVIFPLFHKRNTALLGPRVRQFQISPLNYIFLRNVRLKD